MSVNPFVSLVGLRGVSPTARHWVNDLPGISSELVASLAQPSDRYGQINDADDIAVMWQKVHRNAFARLVQEVLLSLSETTDFQPVVARLSEVTTTGPSVIYPASPNLVGLQLVLPYLPNTALSLRCLSFLADSSASAHIRVYSLTTDGDNPIFDVVMPIEPGYNEIDMNLFINARLLRPLSILIMVDASDLNLVQLTRPAFSLGGTDFGSVQGVTASLSDPVRNLSPGPVLMGLTADLSRDIAGFIPRYADELAPAYALMCGAGILTEKQASPTLSVYTLSNRAFADRMDDKYNADARRALKPIARRILQDLSTATVAPTGQTVAPAVVDRVDLPSIEIGGYV